MQCYTRAHWYPKTTALHDYTAPPAEAYNKRKSFVPEPDKIGRPWCPYGTVMPPPWQHIKRVQFNPLNELHREKHIDEMLPFSNKTNWTCGQDMEVLKSRKSKFSDSQKFSLQSTQRAHYPGHWMGTEPRRNPARTPSIGIAPALYHVLPYVAPECHPFLTKRPSPNDVVDEPNDFEWRTKPFIKVPHYIMEPYPGPQLPEHLKNQDLRKETVSKMGLVQ